MIRKILIFFACFVFFFTGCRTTDTNVYEFSKSDEPAEYTEDEFPGWLKSLRRAEIIFAGSIPFTILLTNVGYGIYNAVSDGFGESYSIENFTESTALTTEERYNILKISLSASVAISLADLIIGLADKPAEDE